MTTQAASLMLGFAVLMCGSTNAQQSQRYGGTGGDRDYRIEVPSDARITEIFGRAGSNVDQIGFRFLTRDNKSGSVSAGGTGGTYWSFPLDKGEYIREVYIRYAKRIDYLEFTTSHNRRKGLGGTGGSSQVRLSMSGKAISGFYGRYGRVLDSLGVMFRSPYVYEPDPPNTLQAQATSPNSICLEWRDASNNEDAFEVERSENGANYIRIAKLSQNKTKFCDSGLTPTKTYWYRVRAVNSGGASGYSNVAYATTRDNKPSAPTSLLAYAVSDTCIELSWRDTSNNETGFEIQWSKTSAGFATKVTTPSDVTRYLDCGLRPSTTYWYRVRAFNSGGPSAWSNLAFATTRDPTPPFKFTPMLSGCAKLTLAGSDKVTGNTHHVRLALLGGSKEEPIAWCIGQQMAPIPIPGSSCSLLVAPLALPVTISTGFIDEMTFTVNNPPKEFTAAVQVLRLLDPLKPSRTIDASNGLRF